MISVAIVTNSAAWLTQITALALPLLSAASSCLFSINNLVDVKREKGTARRRGLERGRDWWWARRMGALRPWSNVYPLNHSKSHLLPSAPHSALHEKHYLSTGAIIHRWLPLLSSLPSHISNTGCCVICACFCVILTLCAFSGICTWVVNKISIKVSKNTTGKKKFLGVFKCVSTFKSRQRKDLKRVQEGKWEWEGCKRGWRVNQGLCIHPLMSASVNKALNSCRHIRWLSRPLGPSWLVEAAHCSQETHLRVYRHLWLVIGSSREINGTVVLPARQLSCAHTHANTHYAHTNHQCIRLNACTPTCAYKHRHEATHMQQILCIPSKLTFAVKILQVY